MKVNLQVLRVPVVYAFNNYKIFTDDFAPDVGMAKC